MGALTEGADGKDSLARVDRDILVVRSAAVYQLLDDPRIITFWMPISQVAICDKVGFVDGQVVNYYEIRHADAREVVWAVAVR